MTPARPADRPAAAPDAGALVDAPDSPEASAAGLQGFGVPPHLACRLYALVPCAGSGERAVAQAPRQRVALQEVPTQQVLSRHVLTEQVLSEQVLTWQAAMPQLAQPTPPAAKPVAKQYASLAGRSVVAHTLAAIAGVARLTQTLVVLSPDDCAFEAAAPEFRGWVARVGGTSRMRSVANGLGELAARGARSHDWVLVHDAARCLIHAEWIDALIDACIDDAVGGLLALPLADTLKIECDGRAASTLDRRFKWQAQTPQMFRIGALREALAIFGASAGSAAAAGTATGAAADDGDGDGDRDGSGTGTGNGTGNGDRTRSMGNRIVIPTDEASAMEALGFAPKLVRGALENFKITWPDDFALAERLLRTRA